MHLVEINARPIEMLGTTTSPEQQFKPADRGGYADTCRMLERRPWGVPIDPATEVTVYESDAPANSQSLR
jgi:hypothetical protein